MRYWTSNCYIWKSCLITGPKIIFSLFLIVLFMFITSLPAIGISFFHNQYLQFYIFYAVFICFCRSFTPPIPPSSDEFIPLESIYKTYDSYINSSIPVPVRRSSPVPIRRSSPVPVRRSSPVPVRWSSPVPVRWNSRFPNSGFQIRVFELGASEFWFLNSGFWIGGIQ